MSQTKETTNCNGKPGAKRCHELLVRVMDITIDEFPDLSPPEIIFVLNWIQHRYYVEIEDAARMGPPGPAQGSLDLRAAPVVCKI